MECTHLDLYLCCHNYLSITNWNQLHICPGDLSCTRHLTLLLTTFLHLSLPCLQLTVLPVLEMTWFSLSTCTKGKRLTLIFFLSFYPLPRNELLCQFLGGLSSNEFHIKWRFGTHGNWKNQNPGGPFWSYQLNNTANLAHFAQFSGKWAKLVVLFTW